MDVFLINVSLALALFSILPVDGDHSQDRAIPQITNVNQSTAGTLEVTFSYTEHVYRVRVVIYPKNGSIQESTTFSGYYTKMPGREDNPTYRMSFRGMNRLDTGTYNLVVNITSGYMTTVYAVSQPKEVIIHHADPANMTAVPTSAGHVSVTFFYTGPVGHVDVMMTSIELYGYRSEVNREYTNVKYVRQYRYDYYNRLYGVDVSQLENGTYSLVVNVMSRNGEYSYASQPMQVTVGHIAIPQITNADTTLDGELTIVFTFKYPVAQIDVQILKTKYGKGPMLDTIEEYKNVPFIRNMNDSHSHSSVYRVNVSYSGEEGAVAVKVMTMTYNRPIYYMSRRTQFSLYPQITNCSQTNNGRLEIIFFYSTSVTRVAVVLFPLNGSNQENTTFSGYGNNFFDKDDIATYRISNLDISTLATGTYGVIVNVTKTSGHVYAVSQPKDIVINELSKHGIPTILNIYPVSDGRFQVRLFYRGPVEHVNVKMMSIRIYEYRSELNIEFTNVSYERHFPFNYLLWVDVSQLDNGTYSLVVNVTSGNGEYSFSSRAKQVTVGRIPVPPRITNAHSTLDGNLTIGLLFKYPVTQIDVLILKTNIRKGPMSDTIAEYKNVPFIGQLNDIYMYYRVNVSDSREQGIVAVKVMTMTYNRPTYYMSGVKLFNLEDVYVPQITDAYSTVDGYMILVFTFMNHVNQINAHLWNKQSIVNANFTREGDVSYRVTLAVGTISRVYVEVITLSYYGPKSFSSLWADATLHGTHNISDGAHITATIAGPVVGGVFIIGLIIFVSICVHRRRMKLSSQRSERNQNIQQTHAVNGTRHCTTILGVPPSISPKTCDDNPPSYSDIAAASAHGKSVGNMELKVPDQRSEPPSYAEVMSRASTTTDI